MRKPVSFHSVRKGSTVYLREDLPPQFGNSQTIAARNFSGMARIGHVIGEGFEQGQLRVLFPLYPEGDQRVEFNELSAAKYLEIDPFI